VQCRLALDERQDSRHTLVITRWQKPAGRQVRELSAVLDELAVVQSQAENLLAASQRRCRPNRTRRPAGLVHCGPPTALGLGLINGKQR
jgi:hypothetical protein